MFSQGLDIEDGILYDIGDCKDLNIVVPNEVTIIKSKAFLRANILSVSFTKKSKLKEIESFAFESCHKLRNIQLPERVECIGVAAFSDCDSIEYTIKNGLLYLGTESNPFLYLVGEKNCINAKIENGSKLVKPSIFYPNLIGLCNEYLESLIIPDGVLRIPSSFCCGCKKLERVYIPQSVEILSWSAFRDCVSLKNLTLPDNLTKIEGRCFEGCCNLSFNVKDNLKYLGSETNPYLYLVGTASSSITTANIDKNCKFIGENAFLDCCNLENIEIPDKVIRIEDSAFKNCVKLKKITIPNGLISIGCEVFQNCKNLESVNIPKSVIELSYRAFNKCKKITVYIERKKEYRKWSWQWNEGLDVGRWKFIDRNN